MIVFENISPSNFIGNNYTAIKYFENKQISISSTNPDTKIFIHIKDITATIGSYTVIINFSCPNELFWLSPPNICQKLKLCPGLNKFNIQINDLKSFTIGIFSDKPIRNHNIIIHELTITKINPDESSNKSIQSKII